MLEDEMMEVYKIRTNWQRMLWAFKALFKRDWFIWLINKVWFWFKLNLSGEEFWDF